MNIHKGVALSLLIGVLTFQTYACDKLVRQFFYGHITLSTIFGRVEFTNCELENEAGRPVVPVQFLTFILPPNVDRTTARTAT